MRRLWPVLVLLAPVALAANPATDQDGECGYTNGSWRSSFAVHTSEGACASVEARLGSNWGEYDARGDVLNDPGVYDFEVCWHWASPQIILDGCDSHRCGGPGSGYACRYTILGPVGNRFSGNPPPYITCATLTIWKDGASYRQASACATR